MKGDIGNLSSLPLLQASYDMWASNIDPLCLPSCRMEITLLHCLQRGIVRRNLK